MKKLNYFEKIYNMKKFFINEFKNLSIKRINFILFFFMFIISIEIIYLNYNDLNIYFLFLLIFFFILFIFFNYLYIKEFKAIETEIKNIIKINKSSLLLKDNIYIENKKNNSLFNHIILNKNLLQKDYSDLKKAFFTFTSEYFLNQIAKKWIDRVELWTTLEKNIHVMFLDIIWFTTITEKLKAERTLLLLNIYFDWIVEIIKKNWWFIDKFLWDWILAIFVEKKSDNAIKASIEIQKFISNFRISAIWRNIYVWIWINSWKVMMWTIGSKDRMEVTIIWDTVNTASRIEWLTRKFKEKILISESTYNLIKDKTKFTINYLWEKFLKWKKQKKKIYWIEDVFNIEIK